MIQVPSRLTSICRYGHNIFLLQNVFLLILESLSFFILYQKLYENFVPIIWVLTHSESIFAKLISECVNTQIICTLIFIKLYYRKNLSYGLPESLVQSLQLFTYTYLHLNEVRPWKLSLGAPRLMGLIGLK